MKIAILGAGALGSVLGGALALGGNDVSLIGERAHMDAIAARGLTLVAPDGAQSLARLATFTAATDVGTVDLVLVLVKAFDTRAALKGIAALIGPDTLVLSLQNGLGHEEVIAEFVDQQHIIAGKTYVCGMVLEAGRVSAAIVGKETCIGELDGSVTPRIESVAHTFNSSGLQCTVSRDIVAMMWDKLLVNVATGALSGITGLSYEYLYDEKLLEACGRAAVQEGIDIAQAAGIRLRFTRAEDSWELARAGLAPSFKSSICQSLENGTRTEVDCINGALVAQGLKYGIPTPVNETLVACIHGRERAIREQPVAVFP